MFAHPSTNTLADFQTFWLTELPELSLFTNTRHSELQFGLLLDVCLSVWLLTWLSSQYSFGIPWPRLFWASYSCCCLSSPQGQRAESRPKQVKLSSHNIRKPGCVTRRRHKVQTGLCTVKTKPELKEWKHMKLNLFLNGKVSVAHLTCHNWERLLNIYHHHKFTTVQLREKHLVVPAEVVSSQY